MSDRKLSKKLQPILKQVWKLSRRLSKTLVNWLLRTVFLLNRQPRNAGFVLPTTVFLILVVALTVGALTFRAFNSTTRTIGNVKSREIYNAATPAIDRARSKLDYLFGKDARLPSGTPSEEFMIAMLLNEAPQRPVGTAAVKVPPLTTGANPYTLTGEKRIDINGDGAVDNAWTYTDGDNAIVYSINFSTPDSTDANKIGSVALLTLTDKQKADGVALDGGTDGPYVRSGPQSNSSAVNCRIKGGGAKVEGGWFQDVSNTSILRKRFQIDAFVVNQKGVDKASPVNFTTLEFLQDYKLDRGNKWGAWFKYDLEAVSGSQMNWNGAMHSEGNIFIGRDDGGIFNSFLISATTSCLFKPESNSEISVREFSVDKTLPASDPKQVNGGVPFKGIIAGAELGRKTEYKSSQRVDKYKGATYEAKTITPGNDWSNQLKDVIGISTDPVKLLTEDIHQAVTPAFDNSKDIIDPVKPTDFNPGRFVSDPSSTQPYVDDLYRADNRYGPKVRYNTANKIPVGKFVGDNITAPPELINDVYTSGTAPGLDGYWERRTFKDSDISSSKVYTGGMRILVGERLELGNPYGWVAPQDRPVGTTNAAKQDLTLTGPFAAGDGTFDNLRTFDAATPANNYKPATVATASLENSDNPGDPLYPPYAYTSAPNPLPRIHENKQRRALRDNLGAVQAATIYHYRLGAAKDGRTPAACLALTAHPGSPYTLRQSVNFKPYTFNGQSLVTDFFYGKGTNGWEFTPPDITSGAMRTALKNLANFAGELDGAFPPKQEAGKIHPDPILTMWGNFSNLKRSLEAGNGSPADQSYQETAGCMLGMLAYDINQVQKFDPSSPTLADQTRQATLGSELYKLMDGDIRNGEVLPSTALATYNYPATNVAAGTAPPALGKYNPRDYDRATPDMFLAELLKSIRAAGTPDPETDPIYQLGILVHEHYQIRRDRTYGFRPSPAANTWNYNPYITKLPGIATDPTYSSLNALTKNKPTLWSSACDPNIFGITGATSTGSLGASALNLTSDAAIQRLALSRLCGNIIPPSAVHDFPGDNNYPSQAAGALEDIDTANPELVITPATVVPDFKYPTNTDPAVKVSDDITRVAGSPAIPSTPNAVFAPLAAAAYNTAAGYANYKRALVAPKFPSLYYIFPEFLHDQDGGITTTKIDHRQPENDTDLDTNLAIPKKLTALPAAFRPWKEPYLEKTAANPYLYQVVNPALTTPTDVLYPPLGVSYAAGFPTGVTSFIYKPLQVFVEQDKSVDLGVTPKATLNDWVQPTIANPAATDPNPNRVIAPDGAIAAIPFQDKVVFNGREWLPTRALDIDLDMLRKSNKGVGDDTWLPVTGIVYAFREDAVREDAIARPASAPARPPAIDKTDARTPGAETDPVLNAAFKVSTKPVDFIADPDRRPHGFRLRNGSVLKRGGGVKDADNFHGLSFITDQPAYIMGNFNLHQETPGGARLEEFKVQLPPSPAAYTSATFYDGRDAGLPEDKFADPDKDLWRPSEILADSVTILSDRFCDGSAIDTFMTAGPRPTNNDGGISNTTSSGSNATRAVYTNTNGSKQGAQVYNDTDKALFGSAGCINDATAGATSFLNQNRPTVDLPNVPNPTPANPQWNWVRENPGDPIYSPVKISRNGNGLIATATSVPVEYSSANDTAPTIKGKYMDNKNSTQSTARALQKIPANAETGVNVIMVSGVVPARQFQGYGALSNFPRFLENWDDGKTNLRFAGSFLQLNFSNYATGPFDDDSWEPGETPITGTEVLPYRPPARLWGYDVALQLAQASPVASRFTSLSNEKNEFYAEPSGSDPYMQNLCKALKAAPPTGFDAAKLNCPA